jgi:hypothetical protein
MWITQRAGGIRMTIGSGLFLSALFLGLVVLYVATRDRWNWARLVKWVVGVPVLLAVIGGLGFWGYTTYQDRPVAHDEFYGLKIGAPRADVRFAKGEPATVDGPDRWTYHAGSGSAGADAAVYLVKFTDDKVRYILYTAGSAQIYHPDLQGFELDSKYDAVLKKLGQASHVANSKDGLERILSFDKYKTFFIFRKGEVVAYGVYDTALGPMEFNPKGSQAPDAAPSASK